MSKKKAVIYEFDVLSCVNDNCLIISIILIMVLCAYSKWVTLMSSTSTTTLHLFEVLMSFYCIVCIV